MGERTWATLLASVVVAIIAAWLFVAACDSLSGQGYWFERNDPALVAAQVLHRVESSLGDSVFDPGKFVGECCPEPRLLVVVVRLGLALLRLSLWSVHDPIL